MATTTTAYDNDSAELRPIGWTGPTGATVDRHLMVWVVLDNRTPARTDAMLTIEHYAWPTQDDGWTGYEYRIPGGLGVFRHGRGALWLLADSADGTVRPLYTSGHHETHRYIALNAFPSELPGVFGPRTCYTLTVRWTVTDI